MLKSNVSLQQLHFLNNSKKNYKIMLVLFDDMLTTSNVEAAKKIQCLFADFNIHGAMTIKEQYNVELHKYVSVNVFLYSLRDISDCAKRNEFLNELGYIMFTYDL